MVMVVTADGPRSTITQGWDGTVVNRAFTVQGLESPADSALWDALNAPGIPVTNDPHPSVPGVVAVNKTVSADNERSATVMVRYEPPTPENAPGLGGQTITTDASALATDSWFDIDGNRIAVTYAGQGFTGVQYPRAQLFSNLATLTFTVNEQVSEADIALRGIDYVETVNDAVWFGWPPKTWRCEDIQSRPMGKFRNWRQVTTILTYKPGDWRQLFEAINNGTAPPDATEGNGFARFDLRRSSDFSALPLTPPTNPTQ